MSFTNQASNIITNKYFLYFMVFISATNVLGYLITNKINAVAFFALVGFLTSNFSKNMSVILLVSVLATNLLMANRTMREGLENATTDTTTSTTTIDKDKLTAIDPKLSDGLNALEETGNVEKAKEKLNSVKTSISSSETKITDINNPDLNTETTSSTDPVAVETFSGSNNKKTSGFHNAKGGSSLKNAAPVEGSSRIDYASTLEGAYDNLDKILGSDGINKLTGDTQKLMSQQQKLFDTMQSMTPMLKDAKDMLKGFDMKELGNLANLSSSFSSAPTVG
jgi:hypothetical protein